MLPSQLQKFSIPDPVDPFGKASGRNLLTMGQLPLVRLLEFTQGEFGLFTGSVNSTRLLKPWRMGRPGPEYATLRSTPSQQGSRLTLLRAKRKAGNCPGPARQEILLARRGMLVRRFAPFRPGISLHPSRRGNFPAFWEGPPRLQEGLLLRRNHRTGSHPSRISRGLEPGVPYPRQRRAVRV